MQRSVLPLVLLLMAASCRSASVPSARMSACERLPPGSTGLELVVLGSGGPASTGRAASGYLVRVDGVARVLVDAGPGTFLRLGELGVDLASLDLVLLTHLHIDHAGDLPGFVKSRDLSSRRALRFEIVGPAAGPDYPSTTEFVGSLFGAAGAFRYLPGFRNELTFAVVDVAAASARTVERPDLSVSALPVDHGGVPALAFRVEAEGRSITFSGDLNSRSDDIIGLARGSDVLVYDTTVLDPPAAPPVLYELHTAPRRIGEVAAASGARSLVLSHLTPSVERAPEAIQASIRAGGWQGPISFAEDCQRVRP